MPGEHSQAGLGASPLLSPPVPASPRLTHPHPEARGALKCPSGHCLITCNDCLVHSLETRSPTAHLSGLSFPPCHRHQNTVFAQVCKVPASSQGQPPSGMLSRIFGSSRGLSFLLGFPAKGPLLSSNQAPWGILGSTDPNPDYLVYFCVLSFGAILSPCKLPARRA